LFVSSLAAAVDVEVFAQQAGEGVGGHGFALVPLVPLAVVSARNELSLPLMPQSHQRERSRPTRDRRR
jgi:hypothetical protein